jgi:hypothetical protein
LNPPGNVFLEKGKANPSKPSAVNITRIFTLNKHDRCQPAAQDVTGSGQASGLLTVLDEA